MYRLCGKNKHLSKAYKTLYVTKNKKKSINVIIPHIPSVTKVKLWTNVTSCCSFTNKRDSYFDE